MRESVLEGRYELGPVLGTGGMARVHRGRDLQLDRPVAVKVLAPPFDRDQAFVRRFRREARSVARLSHPNIVAVFDTGSDGERHFIVTELVEGETLGSLLAREGRLAPDRSVEIARQVCRALSAAHEEGVVHRDVKPANVMLAADGSVKVVDFGIARAAGTEALTRSGFVIGSASYLSPEQARGEPGDERSDVYALGCVLYQMLTGRPPFVADSPVSVLYQHVNEAPQPPSAHGPLPQAVERVVLRCLEKEPDRRFGSAADLERALAGTIGGGATITAPLPVVDGPTAPMPVVDEPTAPIDRSGEPTRPVERAPATAGGRPRPPSHRPRARVRRGWPLVVAMGIVALVAIAAVAVLDDGEPLRPRAAAREDRGASTPTATGTPEQPASVASAFARLVESIVAAQAAGEITEDGAGKLRDRAEELLGAYQRGDAEKLGEAVEKLGEELARLLEEGDVSAGAAGEIAESLDALVVAMQADPPSSPVEGPEDGGKDKDEETGPPPHAEAKGHDDDDDDD